MKYKPIKSNLLKYDQSASEITKQIESVGLYSEMFPWLSVYIRIYKLAYTYIPARLKNIFMYTKKNKIEIESFDFQETFPHRCF